MKAKSSLTLDRKIQSRLRSAKQAMKKGSAAMLDLGRSLAALKELLPRAKFVELVKRELGLSEITSMRMIRVSQTFGKSQTRSVLNSQPSVLTILAASNDSRALQSLAKGAAVEVNGERKTLPELSVRDARKLKVSSKRSRRPKAHDFHRDFVTLLQHLKTWAYDASDRFQDLEGDQRRLVAIAIKDALACLKSLKETIV